MKAISKQRQFLAVVVSALIVGLLLLPGQALANNFYVTQPECGVVESMNWAINQANINPGKDTIIVLAGTFQVCMTNMLKVTNDLTIRGAGVDSSTMEFDINPPFDNTQSEFGLKIEEGVRFQAMKLTFDNGVFRNYGIAKFIDCHLTSGFCGEFADVIFNEGEMTLRNFDITNTLCSEEEGSVIQNDGTLTYTRGRITNSSAGDKCSIRNGPGNLMTLTEVEIADSICWACVTICNSGDLIMNRSSVSNQHWVESCTISNGGNLIASKCSFIGNKVGFNSSAGFLSNRGLAILKQSLIANNEGNAGPMAPISVGGVYNAGDLIMKNCEVTGNIAGGIHNDGGTVTLKNTNVYDNTEYDCQPADMCD